MNQLVIAFSQQNMECGTTHHYFCVTSEQTKEDIHSTLKKQLDIYLNGLIPLNKAINIANEAFMKEFSVERSEDSPPTKAELDFMEAIEAKSTFDNNFGNITIGDSKFPCAYFLFNEIQVIDFSVLTLQEWFEMQLLEHQQK